MAVAVVDTGVLIAQVDSTDPHHDVAAAIVRGMDHGELPTGQVTDYIVLETLNWIHTRHYHQKAVEIRSRLNESAGFEIHEAARKDFARAVDLFETYDRLAFGDATTVAYIEREGIEYLYSFDDDFDGVGDFTRLKTADNPY